jgi:riboflavin synthase
MFTGIVEEIGVVQSVEKTLAGTRLTIMAAKVLGDVTIGGSISVNGACLTVVARTDGTFSVDVTPETVAVTTLGTLAAGAAVNLERAMRLNERLGGHLVAGHVDGIGTIRERRQDGNAIVLTIEAPKEVLRYCVHKGSIAADGISMTINQVTDTTFSLAVIPHTAKDTTLGLKRVGDALNLETDLIGKYVERLLQERGQGAPPSPPKIDIEYLKRKGLL